MIETRNTKKLYFTLLEWYINLGPALRFNIVVKIYCLMQILACVLEEIRQFWIDSWSPLLIVFSLSAQSETFEGGDDQQDAGSPCAERISRAFDVSLQWPRVSMAIALLNLLPSSPDIRLSKSFNVGWNKTLLYMEVAGKNGSLLRSVIPAQNWSHNVDLGEGTCAASNRSRTIERSIPCLTSALKALQNHSLTGQHRIEPSYGCNWHAMGTNCCHLFFDSWKSILCPREPKDSPEIELVQQEAGVEAGVNHKRETPRSSWRGSTGGSTILSDSEGTTTPSTSDGARKIPPAMVVSSTQMLQHDCRTLLV